MNDVLKYLPGQVLLPDGKLHAGVSVSVRSDGEVVGTNPEENTEGCIILDGILVPGFINGHCHLELSGLKNVIPEATRLGGFIREIVTARTTYDTDAATMKEWDRFMWDNGIQGTGDICNTAASIEIKRGSRIRYHSFIEMYDVTEDRTSETMQKGVVLSEEFRSSGLSCSYAPHAPYSVTPALQAGISKLNDGRISSMHFMEDRSERELLEQQTGELYDTMSEMGAALLWMKDNRKGIGLLDPYWSGDGTRILVHNTYINQEDIDHLAESADIDRIWFCLCPNANLYIERQLPDIGLLAGNGLNMMIGTDSLASNQQLSVITEVNTLLENFPSMDAADVLSWATINGADAFGWDDLGRFAEGCKPGGVLLKGTRGSYTAERIF